MKRSSLILSLLLLFSLPAISAEGKWKAAARSGAYDVSLGASSVHREGTFLVVNYELGMGAKVRHCNTALYMSTDGGTTFTRVKKDISGDLKRVSGSGEKQIDFDISASRETLADRQLVFRVDVMSRRLIKSDVFVSAVAGCWPYRSYGFMGGWVGSIAGAYLKGRTGFIFPEGACFSDGTYADGSPMWTAGQRSYLRWCAVPGAMLRATDWLFPYLGVGYGRADVLWKSDKGKWLRVNDYAVKGLTAEAGVLFRITHLALSASVSTTAFRYCEAEVGIGYMF